MEKAELRILVNEQVSGGTGCSIDGIGQESTASAFLAPPYARLPNWDEAQLSYHIQIYKDRNQPGRHDGKSSLQNIFY